MPGGQLWGAVFVTVGPPVDRPRPAIDATGFDCLEVELRGVRGDERVLVGMKDACDPDNGGETKLEVDLAGSSDGEWQRYSFDISDFSANPSYVYVPIEFVFDVEPGQDPPQTIDFRNITFSGGPCTLVSPTAGPESPTPTPPAASATFTNTRTARSPTSTPTSGGEPNEGGGGGCTTVRPSEQADGTVLLVAAGLAMCLWCRRQRRLPEHG